MSLPPSAGGGLLSGLLGVAIFAATLPMTRLAVADLDPVFVAAGRAALAGLLAAAYLGWVRAVRPTRRQWRLLAEIAVGVVVGFPLFSSIAMRSLPASQGAIITGLIPIGTAVAAFLFARERPSPGFWLCALAGSALVVAHAAGQDGGPHGGDLAMVAAVALAALGYSRGGALAREMDGMQVISWALVLTLPLSVAVSAAALIGGSWPGTGWAVVGATGGRGLADVSPTAWAGFLYVSVGSMWVGFLFWYRGMARGGVARVGQMQLLQPFLTVLLAAPIAGEPIAPRTIGFALAVVGVVALGRRMQVATAAPNR